MPLPPGETSIWIPAAVPKSQQAEHLKNYVAQVKQAALQAFPSPLTSNWIEITVLYVDARQRPDVDNVLKPIQDALKGIVYRDDWQVCSCRSAVLPNDPTHRTKEDGKPHGTFARLLDGNHFLIRVKVPDRPTILEMLTSS
jgi:Holliday junction resolvase RusA-like endonuclease